MASPVNNLPKCFRCQGEIKEKPAKHNCGHLFHDHCFGLQCTPCKMHKIEMIETENWMIVAQNLLIGALVLSVFSLFRTK